MKRKLPSKKTYIKNPHTKEIRRLCREKRRRAIPPGMFIMSQGVTNKNELSGWEKSLNDQGIKTQFIQDDQGRFYLCREGNETIGTPYC